MMSSPYIRKRSGPRIDPYGTLFDDDLQCEKKNYRYRNNYEIIITEMISQ